MASVEEINHGRLDSKMQRAGVETLKDTNIPAADGEREAANES